MTNEKFLVEMENSFNRSKKVLLKKGTEYSSENDRLHQFYQAAFIQNINPCEALIGMVTKHFTSIVLMSKNPNLYSMKEWLDKTVDLRNYTILLEALLVDMEVK